MARDARWAFVLVLLATANLIAGSDPKISIFVGPQMRDGFNDADSGIIDSIKDIQGEFANSSHFRLMRTVADATGVLTVVGRRVAGQAGSVGVPIGTSIMFLPIKRRAIAANLRVGKYEKAQTSVDERHDRWTAAAQQVVKDVTAWVDANRTALTTAYAPQPTPTPNAVHGSLWRLSHPEAVP